MLTALELDKLEGLGTDWGIRVAYNRANEGI